MKQVIDIIVGLVLFCIYATFIFMGAGNAIQEASMILLCILFHIVVFSNSKK